MTHSTRPAKPKPTRTPATTGTTARPTVSWLSALQNEVSRLLNPPTRTGKIARLPKALREEINRRLQEGTPGKSIVAWLNSLPEVQTVLAAQFGGFPIREQNLSQWRKRGYRDWVVRQEAVALSERLRRLSSRPAPASDLDLTDDPTRIPVKSDSRWDRPTEGN